MNREDFRQGKRKSPWAEFAEAQRASAEKYGSVCDQIRSSSMALLQEAYEHWLAWNKAMEMERTGPN